MKKFFRFVFGFLLAALIVAGGAYYYYSKDQAEKLTAQMPLDQAFTEVTMRADFVPADQIPQFAKEATVAVEDARFYIHSGLDLMGTFRAALSQVIPVFDRSGGSSITQQVVKNLYGKFEGGLSWKGTEMILALELERSFSKDQILAVYMNIINYGDNFTGIGQASWGYFACEPMMLNDAESSLLAGIPQSPANFGLNDHFDAAKNKQKVVLEAMVRNNNITQEQADQIYAEPISFIQYGQWVTAMADPVPFDGLLQTI